MDSPQITYTPHPGLSPEAELDVLAHVYAFIVSVGEARRGEDKQKAEGRLPSPDGPDGTAIEEDSADEFSIP